MGYEYHLHLTPEIADIEPLLQKSIDPKYQIISSAILDQTSKQTLGIASGETINTKWPHICEFLLENHNLVYVLCHSKEGGLLMNQFIHRLQQAGYNVQIEDV